MSLLVRVNDTFQNYMLTEYEQTKKSPLFFVMPLIKLSVTIWMIIAINQIIKIFFVWILIISVYTVAAYLFKINMKRYFKMLLFLGLFSSLIVAFPLIFISGEKLIFSLKILGLEINIFKESLLTACDYVLRIVANISVVLFLILSTPFTHIIHVLHQLHLPKFLLSILTLTYRYFFLFFESLIKILRADDCRRYNKYPFKKRFKHISNMFSMLLLRSIKRGTRIHRAMLARGFEGEFPDVSYNYKLNSSLYYLLGVVILNLLIFLILI